VQWPSQSAATADIRITYLNTVAVGNDFALDDISLAPVPEPDLMMLLLAGVLMVRRRGSIGINQ